MAAHAQCERMGHVTVTVIVRTAVWMCWTVQDSVPVNVSVRTVRPPDWDQLAATVLMIGVLYVNLVGIVLHQIYYVNTVTLYYCPNDRCPVCEKLVCQVFHHSTV